MVTLPSIQKIASALAQAPRPTIHSPNRVLCLRLVPSSNSQSSLKPLRSWKAISEAFLKFSPRVQLRTPTRDSDAHWVFIEIASTSHLFRGEEGLMRSAMSLARDLGFGVQCAVADTPAGAQAFAASRLEFISPPGEERDRLKELSLPLLLQMEGLESWARPTQVESIVTFFLMLGFKTIGDLSRFSSTSLKERWGETGELLWKRSQGLDRQVISPLIPTEALTDYVHLDFPVSLVSLLLHQTQKSLDFLFARLQGRRMLARKIEIILHCEYSKKQHKIAIEPNQPSRDRELFMTLLENRFNDLDLENPIRDFEVNVDPVPENTRQLDFFEPRTTDQDKLQTLLSLLTQSSIKPGLYQIESAILPERGWKIVASPSASYDYQKAAVGYETSIENAGHSHALASSRRAEFRKTKKKISTKDVRMWAVDKLGEEVDPEMMTSPLPEYGASVMQAPRPTRLLPKPQMLTTNEMRKLKILSSNPIERLENEWWESEEMKRDYYFAVSQDGQCLWIFQDLTTQEYFLHGYFD